MVARSHCTLKACCAVAPVKAPSRQKPISKSSTAPRARAHSTGPLGSNARLSPMRRDARSSRPISRLAPPKRHAACGEVVTSDCSAQPSAPGAMTQTRRAKRATGLLSLPPQAGTGSASATSRKAASEASPAADRKVPRCSAVPAISPASTPSGDARPCGRSSAS